MAATAKDATIPTYADCPIRDVMPINANYSIICWHNKAFTKTRYDLAQREYKADRKDTDTWFVRASFAYSGEFFKYVAGFNFDEGL